MKSDFPSAQNLADNAMGLYAACKLFVAWLESDNAGPDYGPTLTRDTHPHGEQIWQQWWNLQQTLCEEAQRSATETLNRIHGRS